jgi:streptomycin 6-kinase
MTTSTLPNPLLDRIRQHAREWRLAIEESFETETSVISFVSRDGQSLVLKVVKQQGDEWNAGEILKAFDGNGVVRVYEHTAGAMLLERLRPGSPLSNLTLSGNDEEATDILAGVINKMSPREIPDGCPTVEDWGKAFDRYVVAGDERIPRQLVELARRNFSELCASQSHQRLLHGDLHHYNVLSDANRGWLAIDPKGVIGELEYEVGAVLRNPYERPELFILSSTIERRLEQFTNKLPLDYERTLRWAFAQAVLSAIWSVEDGFAVDAKSPALKLAEAIRPMLMAG